MIRVILIPEINKIQFSVPDEYIGKEIEVIAFIKEEGREKKIFSPKNNSFTVLHVEEK